MNKLGLVSRRLAPAVAIAVASLVTGGLLAPATSLAVVSTGSIVLTPATISSPPGVNGTFTVAVSTTASVATTGAQASVTFDNTVLQIQSATYAASGWGIASIRPVDLSSSTVISTANTAGKLAAVAAGNFSTFPASTSEPFFSVTFKVIACPGTVVGPTLIGLPVNGNSDAVIDDDGGNPISGITTTGASVTPCSGSATPTPTPGGTATPTPTPGGTATPTPAPTATQTPQDNTLTLSPATTSTATTGTFTLTVVQHTVTTTTGAQATINFDKTLLEIESVAKGTDYASSLLVGADSTAITTANSSGTLANVGASLIVGSIPIGGADVIDITFKAIACSASSTSIEMPVYGGSGAATDSLLVNGATTILVSTTGATVSIPCDATVPPDGATPPPTDAAPAVQNTRPDGAWLLVMAILASVIVAVSLVSALRSRR